jgi:hypothetical protein
VVFAQENEDLLAVFILKHGEDGNALPEKFEVRSHFNVPISKRSNT